MIHPRSHAPCVGILYCGDLGAAVARLLGTAGVRVVSTCEGRSARTRERARGAGVEILATLDDVMGVADVIISLVLPDMALLVARQCVERRAASRSSCLYVEANSIDLATLYSIRDIFAETCFRFVDAAFHGGAGRLEEMGVMYVSGIHATEIERLFSAVVRVLSLGDEIGHATRMKLLMAGQSKCLSLLFLQIAIIASKAGMLDQFLGESKSFYPEIMVAVERMLPTYPEHAARRVTELESIEELARSVDAPHQMIHSARDLLQDVAGEWGRHTEPPPTFSTIIKRAAPPQSTKKDKHEL